jgi:hypothetical protein
MDMDLGIFLDKCQHCDIVIKLPQKRRVCLPRSYRGNLDEASIHKHNTESIQQHYDVKVNLLHIISMY